MRMNWYMDSAVLLAQDRQFHHSTIQRSYKHADSTSGLVYYIILKTLLMFRCYVKLVKHTQTIRLAGNTHSGVFCRPLSTLSWTHFCRGCANLFLSLLLKAAVISDHWSVFSISPEIITCCCCFSCCCRAGFNLSTPLSLIHAADYGSRGPGLIYRHCLCLWLLLLLKLSTLIIECNYISVCV